MLILRSLIMMHLSFYKLLVFWSSFSLFNLEIYIFCQVEDFFSSLFLQICCSSCSLLSSVDVWDECWLFPHCPSGSVHFAFLFHFLSCSDWVNPIDLGSRSLILSSVISTILLSLTRKFLISAIVSFLL